MSEPSETESSAPTIPVAPPPAPESRFLFRVRRVLFISVISIPILIILMILFARSGVWWLMQWMNLLLVIALCFCMVAALLRLGHALWITAQYAMSELLFTFFSASLASMALVQWLQSSSGDYPRNFDQTGPVAAIVIVTFMLFLAGSAWAWSVFRRAPLLALNRYAGLVCGWISGLGLLSMLTFLMMTLIVVLADERIPDLYFYWGTFLASFLSVPGFLIERAARRSIKSSAGVSPASTEGNEGKDSAAA